MPKTYEPISTQTLATTAASVEFTSIPGTYTDLILTYTGTKNQTNTGIQFNNDTATNYSYQRLFGEPLGVSADTATNQSYITTVIDSGGRTNVLTHINNYANTTMYKTVISTGVTNSADAVRYNTTLVSGMWRSTTAITSVKVIRQGLVNFSAGSIFTLYGIKAF